MFKRRHIYLGNGDLNCFTDDIIHLSHDICEISAIESATSTIVSTNSLSAKPESNLINKFLLVNCNSIFLSYNAESDSFLSYEIATFNSVPRNPLLKTSLKLTISSRIKCCSKLNDNMFFYGSEDELAVQAVLAFRGQIILSPLLRLDKYISANSGLSGSIGKVISMCCHPSKQFVFLALSNGAVLVWSYANLYKVLLQQAQSSTPNQQDDMNQSGQVQDENDEILDDESEMNDNINQKQKRQSTTRLSRDPNAGLFILCSVITPSFNLPASSPPLDLNLFYANELSIDHHGRYLAIVWSGSITCVYDISSLLQLTPMNLRDGMLSFYQLSQNSLLVFNLYGLYCCDLLSNGIDAKFGSVCFHPTEGLMFQTVLRKLTNPSKNNNISSYSIPVVPIIHAVSLFLDNNNNNNNKSENILACVSAYEIADGLDKYNSKNCSINMYPLYTYCTNISGQFAISFEIVFIPDSTYSITSNNNNYNNDSQTMQIILMYSIDPVWKKKCGFGLGTPIINTIVTPCDTFSHGDLAINFCASYNDKGAAPSTLALNKISVNAIATKDNSIDNMILTIDKKNQTLLTNYPLLLTLKPSYDYIAIPVGKGNDAKVSTVSSHIRYHLFQINWIPTSSANNNNNNNGNNLDSPAAYIGKIPSILNNDIITHRGLVLPKLDDDDYLSSILPNLSEKPLVWLTPHSIKVFELSTACGVVNNSSSTKQAASVGWNAIIRASCRKFPSQNQRPPANSDCNEINRILQHNFLPCTLLINYSNRTPAGLQMDPFSSTQPNNIENIAKPNLEIMYLSFRDLSYWCGNTSSLVIFGNTISENDVKLNNPPKIMDDKLSLLAITSNGLELKWINNCNGASVNNAPEFSDPFSNFEYQHSNSANNIINENSIKASWKLSEEVMSLWPSPIGSFNQVLFATSYSLIIEDGLSQSDNNPNKIPAQQSLLGVPYDVSDFNFSNEKVNRLNFELEEYIIDLLWQPLPSLLSFRKSTAQNTASVQSASLPWLLSHENKQEPCPMIGILTTKRVLLVDNNLEIINSFQYGHLTTFSSQQSNKSNGNNNINDMLNELNGNYAEQTSEKELFSSNFPIKNINELISSIIWMGSVLLYISESGSVNYLIPSGKPSIKSHSININNNNNNNNNNNSHSNDAITTDNNESYFYQSESRLLGIQGHGYYNNYKSQLSYDQNEVYSFLNLPRNISMNQSVRIIGVLSDRLIIVYMKPSRVKLSNDCKNIIFTCPQSTYTTRPINPVEPIILGLITQNNSQNDIEFDNIYSLISLLISYYYHPKSVSVSSTMIQPNSHVTRRIIFYLSNIRGFESFASVIIGKSANDTSVNFPKSRWIPSGSKISLLHKIGDYQHSIIELLASSGKSALVDLFNQTETYGGTSLPHIDNHFSKQYKAVARLCKEYGGQLDYAARLSDISGDYYSVCQCIIEDISLQPSSVNPLLTDLLNEIIKDYSKYLIYHNQISLKSFGNTGRKLSVTPLPKPLDVTQTKDNNNYNTNNFKKLNLFESQHSERSMARKGCLGPNLIGNYPLGVITGTYLEDYMGINRKLETIDSSDKSFGNAAGISGNNAEEDDDTKNIPTDWVQGVGDGREWDKVVGYYRFSDVVYPNEDGFVNSSKENGSRLVFVDLSKFEGYLELFFNSIGSSMSVETSQSNVDPGEKHENVKSLFDVIYNQYDYNAALVSHNNIINTIPICGLRTIVKRGSQLDIGLYHVDRDRSKCTIEMTLSLFQPAVPTTTTTNNILMKRDLLDNNQNLWCLYVDHDGFIIFELSYKNESDGSIITTPHPKRSIKSTADAITGWTDSSSQQSPVWTHIAIVLDSTQSNTTNNQQMIQSSHPLSVIIYINGSKNVEGFVEIPAMNESSLHSTILYVGMNLPAKWRFTELRVWADCRSEAEIDGQKESYLVLAMKRKRVQLRIKGAKKLFSPFRNIEIGEPSTSIIQPVVSSDANNNDNEKDPAVSTTTSVASKPLLPTKPSALGSTPVKGVLAPSQPTGIKAPMSAIERRKASLAKDQSTSKITPIIPSIAIGNESTPAAQANHSNDEPKQVIIEKPISTISTSELSFGFDDNFSNGNLFDNNITNNKSFFESTSNSHDNQSKGIFDDSFGNNIDNSFGIGFDNNSLFPSSLNNNLQNVDSKGKVDGHHDVNKNDKNDDGSTILNTPQKSSIGGNTGSSSLLTPPPLSSAARNRLMKKNNSITSKPSMTGIAIDQGPGDSLSPEKLGETSIMSISNNNDSFLTSTSYDYHHHTSKNNNDNNNSINNNNNNNNIMFSKSNDEKLFDHPPVNPFKESSIIPGINSLISSSTASSSSAAIPSQRSHTRPTWQETIISSIHPNLVPINEQFFLSYHKSKSFIYPCSIVYFQQTENNHTQ
eukprot:gene8711-11771_t